MVPFNRSGIAAERDMVSYFHNGCVLVMAAVATFEVREMYINLLLSAI